MTDQEFLSTQDFAEKLLVTPGTVRQRLCRTQSYFGVKPLKGPNGRLLWPKEALDWLLKRETVNGLTHHQHLVSEDFLDQRNARRSAGKEGSGGCSVADQDLQPKERVDYW